MASPARELDRLDFDKPAQIHRSSDENTIYEQRDYRPGGPVDSKALHERLGKVEAAPNLLEPRFESRSSPSQTREEASRLHDDLALLKAEKVVSEQAQRADVNETSLHRSRSRQPEPVDEFDTATNPIHERAQVYKPPENPTTKLAQFFKYIHQSSWVIRYFTYIVPIFLLLLIPVLMGALLPAGKSASVGGVELLWFGVWLEIVWLTLWAGRIIAKLIPYPLGLISSLFTNNSKKWRDMGKQLEIPATIFFWWLAIEISFLPTTKNHHSDGSKDTKDWEKTLNKIIISVFVAACLNFIEKIIIQLIAISFHLRTYADRIEMNKFQIGCLTKLYVYSKARIAMEDTDFEEKTQPPSGARTPGLDRVRAQGAINKAVAKVGDVAGTVAGDFTGKKVEKSGHPSQVVLTLLNATSGSQILARRLYRTFVRDGFDTVFSGDLKPAFDNEEEAEAAFSMFDKDMNGDISMEELEAVCVEIGRERKSITASLKDLDSVVSKLDDVLFFIVMIIAILVLISLISTSAAGVLTSAGSAVLALSWLFSATAQEFLQSIIFVFVKHPFDVGDRVTIYGNTGASGKGDDYFVKEISLLYTEFKKMEGHVVQAPNSYLNTLFILNMRRSGGVAEAVPVVIRFGTTLQQIDDLRQQLIEFVLSEKREYQGKILTELREVTEAYSLTLNVIFFYKSNWQNELLRLQRRNKFICAMMVAMQELGIEGPRRNNAGWRTDNPMFLTGHGAPPSYQSAPAEGGAPPANEARSAPSGEKLVAPTTEHPSILRHNASHADTAGRKESLSTIAKRVDFSLGMKDVASGDFLSDVSDDYRSPSRFREIIRESNEDAVKKAEAEKMAEKAAERATSRDGGRPSFEGGLFRRGTNFSTTGTRQRGESVGSQTAHRNRFLSRIGHSGRSFDLPRDSLAEEGQAGPARGIAPLDSRSGNVSNQAVRTESTPSNQEPGRGDLFPTVSETQDVDLKRMESRLR